MVKYCKKCGAKIEDDKNFCPKCGEATGNTNIVTKTPTKTSMSTGKKVGIIVLILIVVFIILAIASTPTNTQNKTTINVSDVNIKSQGYGVYDISANIVPDKDYSYLEMQVTFYDSEGAIVEKSSLVWNINNVESGQTIKANGPAYCQKTPARAEVKIFDSSLNTESNNALFTTEVNL